MTKHKPPETAHSEDQCHAKDISRTEEEGRGEDRKRRVDERRRRTRRELERSSRSNGYLDADTTSYTERLGDPHYLTLRGDLDAQLAWE